ncbi:hypothetical protein [Sinimarinibacterium flocculans]|uniref:hypothetical protein n=1 Tax=Sinimarinibacterium flocculans TaxID=985250 RepID=UPI0024930DB8|nr:hypothetical protein [Sinimarinibacterium flocculans]
MADLDGRGLLAGLADGSLGAGQFGHRDHVRAAWQCLREDPLPQAAHRFSGLLRDFVKRVGAEDKYHHTLTLALMHLIDVRRRETPGDWDDFVRAYPELFRDARKLVEQHYAPDLLDSVEARRAFVEPNRAPLP